MNLYPYGETIQVDPWIDPLDQMNLEPEVKSLWLRLEKHQPQRGDELLILRYSEQLAHIRDVFTVLTYHRQKRP
jgi:hypothetical protein